jgi:alkylation response protein AidB-like acyl-CoA dehydrogenase
MAMDMVLDPAELRDTARKLLEKATELRAAYGDGPGDAGAALRNLMAEQGWMLLTTPVEQDGLGQSFEAIAPIYQELGRVLSSAAYVGTMAAADVLGSLDSADAREWLARIGSGEAIFALAAAGGVNIADGKASGALSVVWEAGQATHLLLLPEGPDSCLAIVDLAGAVLTQTPMWDRTRTVADVQLSGTAASILLSGKDAADAAVLAQAHIDLALACDSLGGADRCLEASIEYMATRQQFNRPIGSFQALKHRSADLKVGLEIARAFANDAVEAFVSRRQGWSFIAAQAKLLASGAFRAIAEESVQFHGGVGFTWEYDCHLFLKRALLNEVLCGTPEAYKDRIAPDILRRAFAA